jgi:hypothetical protein
VIVRMVVFITTKFKFLPRGLEFVLRSLRELVTRNLRDTQSNPLLLARRFAFNTSLAFARLKRRANADLPGRTPLAPALLSPLGKRNDYPHRV